MPADPELSVVVPVYNEAQNLRPLAARLTPTLARCCASFETIFVDDGSADETLEVCRALNAEDGRYVALSFSRNFGKEVAILAGLDHARGAAVVIMDADLQHPPELIETFVACWRAGYENVYGQRLSRDRDPWLRRQLTRLFYRMLRYFGDATPPRGSGDFRLLDRKAVVALRGLREQARFTKGLYAWIGFKSLGVPFEMQPRAHGASKFGFLKLFGFALDGLMSFSSIPLKAWTYIGLAISGFALALAGYFFIRTLFYGVDVPGYPSLIVSIAFFSGVQLISLGVLGEYLARIFNEVKGRPLYLVAETVGMAQAAKLADDDRSAPGTGGSPP